MAGTTIEPVIYPVATDNVSVQALATGAYQNIQPENSFEKTLTEVEGGVGTLGFLASDGVAFATNENPSFGGTVVSTAISNLGTGNPYATGYGYGGAALPASYGTGFSGTGGGIGGTTIGASVPGGVTGSGSFGTQTAGLNGATGGSDLQKSIMDQGVQQILLMVQVQQAVRTLDAWSNIEKAKHDSNMNTLRNIRS